MYSLVRISTFQGLGGEASHYNLETCWIIINQVIVVVDMQPYISTIPAKNHK